jgi:deoxycytidylate deaminase
MLNFAIQLASQIKSNKYRLCAIITDKKGIPLSIGNNSYTKSHPKQAYYAEKTGNKNRIFLHSELDAIIKLPYNSKPYAIYVARVGKNGQQLLARPCIICQEAIKDIGIRKIYYTKE